MSVLYIGIDPGLKGGIAFLYGDDVSIFKTPILHGRRLPKRPKGSGRRRKRSAVEKDRYDLDGMYRLLTSEVKRRGLKIGERQNVHIVLEQNLPRPNENLGALYQMGRNIAVWLGMTNRFGRVSEVPPHVWKLKMFGKSTKGDKAVAIALANKYAKPHHVFKASEDGPAEAFLMAHFARRFPAEFEAYFAAQRRDWRKDPPPKQVVKRAKPKPKKLKNLNVIRRKSRVA